MRVARGVSIVAEKRSAKHVQHPRVLVCVLVVLSLLVACGQGHDSAHGDARRKRGTAADRALVYGALQVVGHISMGAPKQQRVLGLRRVWKELPAENRAQVLLRVAQSKSHLRYVAGACLALAKPVWAANQAFRKVDDEGFAADPAVLGDMIYWGSSSVGKAISRGRRLLRRKNGRSRMAGHFILTLTTLQARAPNPWRFSIEKVVEVPTRQWDFTKSLLRATPDEIYRGAWEDALLHKKHAQGELFQHLFSELISIRALVLHYQREGTIKMLSSRAAIDKYFQGCRPIRFEDLKQVNHISDIAVFL